MSDRVKTVTIKRGGKSLRINEDDYDRERDGELVKDDDAEGQVIGAASFNPDAPVSPSAPVIGHPNSPEPNQNVGPMGEGDGERRVVLSDPQPPAGEAPQRFVTKQGSKHFVVDAKGEKIEADGINASGYKTEGEAWAAINPALGGGSSE